MTDDEASREVDMIMREVRLQVELVGGMLTRERTAELRHAADEIEGTQDIGPSPEMFRKCYDWFVRVAAIGIESAASIKLYMKENGIE